MRRAAALLGTLLLLTAAAPESVTVNGTSFGKRQIIAGVWFTNFENSRFLQCNDADCDNRPLADWASIECSPSVCKDLDDRARKLAGQKVEIPPDGSFKVRFIGRVGLTTHKPRHIGDGEHSVLIERVLEVRPRPD